MTEPKTIEYRLAEARHHLRNLQAELAEACNHHGDPDAPEILALDRQIEEATAAIRRLEAFEVHSKTRVSTEELERERQNRKASRRKVIALAKQRIPVAGRLDAKFAEIGGLLQEWAAIGVECRNAAGQVHRESQSFDYHMFDLAFGRNGTAAVALASAMTRAGVGQTGIPLEGVPTVPLGSQCSLVTAAELQVKKLEVLLEGHLKSYGEKP